MNKRNELEEEQYTIVSIIRILSDMNLTRSDVDKIRMAANVLKSIRSDGVDINDYDVWRLYNDRIDEVLKVSMD